MSDEEFIDFKKEFENFKKELENSKPIFNDDSVEFTDFDNLLGGDSNGLIDSNDFNNDHPKIDLETDDILMNLTIKKDYSQIKDLDERKREFIKDLKDFINEFESTEEFKEFMRFFD